MIAVIIIIVGLYVIGGALVSALQRTIPLACGFAIAWLVGVQTDAWAAAIVGCLLATGLVAACMDEAAERPATRSLAVAIECLAAMAITTILAFAIFYSAGVRGVELLAVLAICGVLGAGFIARFRQI